MHGQCVVKNKEFDRSHIFTDGVARITYNMTFLHRLNHMTHYPTSNHLSPCSLHTESSPTHLSYQRPVKIRQRPARCGAAPTFLTAEPFTPLRNFLTYQFFPIITPPLHVFALLPRTQGVSSIPNLPRLLFLSTYLKRDQTATCLRMENVRVP